MKTVGEIASLVGGTVHGDAEIEIHTVGSLDRAGTGALAYAEEKYLEHVPISRAACVLVSSGDFPGRTVIIVEHPGSRSQASRRLSSPGNVPSPGSILRPSCTKQPAWQPTFPSVRGLSSTRASRSAAVHPLSRLLHWPRLSNRIGLRDLSQNCAVSKEWSSAIESSCTPGPSSARTASASSSTGSAR